VGKLAPFWRGWSCFQGTSRSFAPAPAMLAASSQRRGSVGHLGCGGMIWHFQGLLLLRAEGCQRTSPGPRLHVGMLRGLLGGLAADASSAFIPGHRSHCKYLIMKRGKRKKTQKQGTSVLSILQQLATV